MKTILVTIGAFCLFTMAAEARPSHKSQPSTITAAEVRQPAGDPNFRFGLGFASYGSAPVAGAMISPALSGWFDFGPLMSLQVFTGINSTSPFQFGFGSIFRYTLHGSQADGFHAGFGFDLGTVGATSSFFLYLAPVIGYHFALGGVLSNLSMSFDGGPILFITPSPFQFGLSPLSQLLGVSIHYFF